MPSEQHPLRSLIASSRNAAFILGIILLLISLIAFRFTVFTVFAPIFFAISLAAIAMSSSMPKTPLAIAIGFVALGATARSFVPPQVCGLTALITSSIGFALSGWELFRSRAAKSALFPLFGLAVNGGVVLLSVLLVAGFIERHLIDILEHGHELTLKTLGIATTAGILLLLGTSIWCWTRAHSLPDQTTA